MKLIPEVNATGDNKKVMKSEPQFRYYDHPFSFFPKQKYLPML